MRDSVSPPTGGVPHPFALSVTDETVFLLSWDNDIKRAARASALGSLAEAADLAQLVRMRLLVVHRGFPEAPDHYLRAVITNVLRSARRKAARSFTANSPLALPVTERLQLVGGHVVATTEPDIALWVSRLPRRLQELFRHVYADGRSQREVARIMGLSQPRVAQLHRQLLQRGRTDFAELAA